jgi:hypothetical protein
VTLIVQYAVDEYAPRRQQPLRQFQYRPLIGLGLCEILSDNVCKGALILTTGCTVHFDAL